jgi:hypothetical protein
MNFSPPLLPALSFMREKEGVTAVIEAHKYHSSAELARFTDKFEAFMESHCTADQNALAYIAVDLRSFVPLPSASLLPIAAARLIHDPCRSGLHPISDVSDRSPIVEKAHLRKQPCEEETFCQLVPSDVRNRCPRWDIAVPPAKALCSAKYAKFDGTGRAAGCSPGDENLSGRPQGECRLPASPPGHERLRTHRSGSTHMSYL